ncbi:MAG: carbohydrate kinase [Pseudomonadota bacterium]
MTILVCGEALYDVFFDTERPEGFDLDARIGGSAFNVAMGLGRLGHPCGLLTGLSRDRLGQKLHDRLADEGVATRYLARKDATTTLAMVSLDASGGAQYQFYGKGAADRMVMPDDCPDPSSLAALVFGCFSLLTAPTGDTFLDFSARAAAAGTFVALDPNVRPTVEPDANVWRARVAAFAQNAAFVKASSDDVAFLHPGETLESVAERWLSAGASAVALTDGGKGATLYRVGEITHVAAPAVTVADTVGAGDSFLAAFLVALADREALSPRGLRDLSKDEAAAVLSFAVAAAAKTCTRRGADLPRRAEI